jgi:septal ring factor EnvC (AmiA/AmiB activator)
MSSSETTITFTVDQFIILIIAIVGAALGVMGYIYRQTGKIHKILVELDKKIAVIENEKKHLQEDLKDGADRLRDIEKAIIPAGISNISDIKEAIEKSMKKTVEEEGKKQ